MSSFKSLKSQRMGKNTCTLSNKKTPQHAPTTKPQKKPQTKTKTPNPVNVDAASRRFNRKALFQETNCQHREYQLVLFLAKLTNCADLVLTSHTASLCLYSPESGVYRIAMKRLCSCSQRLKNLGKRLLGNSGLAAYSLIYRLADLGTCW